MPFFKWLLILALILVGCGGEDDENTTSDNAVEPTTAFNPDAGPDLNLGSSPDSTASVENQLPGCSDPDSEECPMPLELELDGEASAGGVTIRYPARYFTATTHDAVAPGMPLIEIAPSENNKFQERALFEVYFAESEEAALAALENPESGLWTTATLSGTIGVSKDTSQTPQMNNTIGVFTLDSGQVLVVQVVTTEKYGWDLWSRVYAAMLETITVTSPEG